MPSTPQAVRRWGPACCLDAVFVHVLALFEVIVRRRLVAKSGAQHIPIVGWESQQAGHHLDTAQRMSCRHLTAESLQWQAVIWEWQGPPPPWDWQNLSSDTQVLLTQAWDARAETVTIAHEGSVWLVDLGLLSAVHPTSRRVLRVRLLHPVVADIPLAVADFAPRARWQSYINGAFGALEVEDVAHLEWAYSQHVTITSWSETWQGRVVWQPEPGPDGAHAWACSIAPPFHSRVSLFRAPPEADRSAGLTG